MRNYLDANRRLSVASASALKALGIEYLSKLPAAVPAGKVLVHNHVTPMPRLNMNGFRAWLQPPDRAKLQLCRCGWAPQCRQHHRVKQ
jgi:hypothetical protein